MAATARHSTRQDELESITVNGVRIAYVDTGGTGVPLVLVHGSWGSHHNWDAVALELAAQFRVVCYDRRGHSDSERPPGQGHFSEDVADLAALIERLDLAPAWVVGNSSGAVITLQLAAARPAIVRGIVVHEPPLFDLLEPGSAATRAVTEVEAGPLAEVERRIAAGDHGGAAELFVEQVALGPGGWAGLPDAVRAVMTANASTYLDELHDPEWRTVDETRLARYGGPAILTSGDQSPPIFGPIEDRIAQLLPQSRRTTYPGAGHVPHLTHPREYVAEVATAIEAAEAGRP